MDSKLVKVRDLFTTASARLDALLERTPEERWHHRPEPGSWSASECVAHLNITHEQYLPRLRQGLEGAPANGPGRLRTGLVGGIFATLVGPLPRIGGRRRGRVKAPPAFVPGGDLPRDEVVARFRTHQAELLELVEACRHRDVDGVEIQSPFSDSFRFTFFATLVILGQHQHRHLQQAEEAAEVAS